MISYSFYLTEAQEATAQRLGIHNFIFTKGFEKGVVGAIQIDDNEITCYTIFEDGEYAHEVRDFTSEGWKPADE